MHTDFSVFCDRLAEACCAREVTETKICTGIGLRGRLAINLSLSGPGALDLYCSCLIADALDLSADWLLCRSNVMSAMETPEPPKRKVKKPGAFSRRDLVSGPVRAAAIRRRAEKVSFKQPLKIRD
jgi:hypothetical protein